MKPRRGSASKGVQKINNLSLLKKITELNKKLLIQQFISGQEYGIDVYRDIVSKEIISIFIKKKIRMRAGETDKAVSIKDEKIVNIVRKVIEKLDLIGPIDIDLFKEGEKYYFSEINPRFGGGYPLAYECGLNFPLFIKNNMMDKKNKVNFDYREGRYMLKCNDVIIKNKNQLQK